MDKFDHSCSKTKKKKPHVNQKAKTLEDVKALKSPKEEILSGNTKVCGKCLIDKPIEHYNFRKNKKSIRNTCKHCDNEQAKKYYELNKESINKRQKIHYSKPENKEKARNRARKINSTKYSRALRSYKESLPERKLKRRIRNRLARILKRNGSIESVVIGCSGKELKAHLESKFQSGMTWENYGHGNGKWVIDHIKPLALFNHLDKEDLKKASHYTNLQPLWYDQNEAKSDNYDHDHPMGWKGFDVTLEG